MSTVVSAVAMAENAPGRQLWAGLISGYQVNKTQHVVGFFGMLFVSKQVSKQGIMQTRVAACGNDYRRSKTSGW